MADMHELHCVGCDRYVQFDLSLDVDGRYVIQCPVCSKKHYRFVLDGVVKDGKRLYYAADLPGMGCLSLDAVSVGVFSYFDNTAKSSMRLRQAWIDKEG